MKRFHFPLDRVRRWRLEQLNVEELKLQQVRAERQLLAEAKQQMRDRLAKSRSDMLGQPSVLGLELENLDSYGIHVREMVRGFEKLEQAAEAKVVEQRNRVLEARRQFELLDRLRTKALVKWARRWRSGAGNLGGGVVLIQIEQERVKVLPNRDREGAFRQVSW